MVRRKTRKKKSKKRRRTLKFKRKKYKKRRYRRSRGKKRKSRKKKQRGVVSFVPEDFNEPYMGRMSWSFNPNKTFDQNPDKIRGRRGSSTTPKP